MKFSLVTVYVKDMNQSIAFYQGLLGLNLMKRHPIENGGELAMLGQAGQPQIELLFRPGKEPTYSGFSIGIDVDSLENAIALMKEEGFPILRGPISPSPDVTFAFFKDPNGIEIEFIEQKA